MSATQRTQILAAAALAAGLAALGLGALWFFMQAGQSGTTSESDSGAPDASDPDGPRGAVAAGAGGSADPEAWPFADPSYEERDDPEQTRDNVGLAVQAAGLGTFVRCAVPPDAPSLYPHNMFEIAGHRRTEGALSFVSKGPLRETLFNGPDGRAAARARWKDDGTGCVIEPIEPMSISGTLAMPPDFDASKHELLVCGQLVEVGPDGFFEAFNPVPERIRADGTRTRLTCGVNLDGVELDEVELGEAEVSVYADADLASEDMATSDEAPWELSDPLPEDIEILQALDQRQDLLDPASKRWVEENLRILSRLQPQADAPPE